MSKETLGTQELRAEPVAAVRVILLSEGGNFLLVHYKDTPWLGLPGGKVEFAEYKHGNLLATGAFPTLKREVEEECGINISPYLTRSACLGLTEEVWSIARETRTPPIRHGYVSIFLCFVPESTFAEVMEGVVVANLNSHLPGPLFPDARVAVEHLKNCLREKREGPILPEFLGLEKPIWFQIAPTMGLLFGRPEYS